MYQKSGMVLHRCSQYPNTSQRSNLPSLTCPFHLYYGRTFNLVHIANRKVEICSRQLSILLFVYIDTTSEANKLVLGGMVSVFKLVGWLASHHRLQNKVYHCLREWGRLARLEQIDLIEIGVLWILMVR